MGLRPVGEGGSKGGSCRLATQSQDDQAEQEWAYPPKASKVDVDARDMQAMRKMAQIKTETFTATSGADAREKVAAWKVAHPTVQIIAEHKPIAAAPLGSAQAGRWKHVARLVSISIDYQD